MKPERWLEIENLYNDVVDLDPIERDVRLAMISDQDLRHEVISLVQAGPLPSTIAAKIKEERERLLVQHGVPIESGWDTALAHSSGAFPLAFKTGDLVAGRYQIVEFLGQGGMGEVYEAEDNMLNERVALKLFRPRAPVDEAYVKRFRREVQLARRITHPNVCRVFDISWDAGSRQGAGAFFLTMEFLRGETLAARLKRTSRLAPSEALPIAVQLCQALEAAHNAGVLHRDFKCSNVILTGTGEQGRAVVTDFGIAQFLDTAPNSTAALSSENAIIGTPSYMSPEQLEGKELTKASDIYSLGLVLYEMVTGVRPFYDESRLAEAMKRLAENPDPPVKVLPTIGEQWNFTILRCLQRIPARRFSSAIEVAESLNTPPSSAWLRLRHRAVVMTAMMILAAVTAFAFRARIFLPALPSTKHIAVLPFTFAGDDPANQAMASELSASLTGNLAHLQTSDGRVWIVPWKNVQKRPFDDEKHAAASLGVNLLLNGEITKLNNGLSLRTRLLDANTLKELRSGVVEVSSQKIVTLEDNLLAQASAMLQLELPQGMLHQLPVDETTEPGAYEFYAKGRGYMLRRKASDMDRAISLFQKAIQKDPKFAPPYADLGFAYAWKYRFTQERSWLDQASEACAQALALNDKLASAHVSFGMIQQYTGHLEQAIAEYQQALRLDPENEDVRDLLSIAYDNAGRVIEAETLLQDALKRNRANWVSYDVLGIFYYNHANYAQAEPLFRAAAELAPDNPTAFDLLGIIYLVLGRFKEAEDMLRKSIAIEPTAGAYANLGTVLRSEHRDADSAAMLEKAAELTPNNHVIWFNLGNAYHQLQQQEKATQAYEKAAEIAEKGLNINAGSGDLLLTLAQYYAVLGKKEKALHTLAQVTGPFAATPDALFQSAVVYQMADKPELALKTIRSALLAGLPVSRIESTSTFASLHTDKRYLEIIKNHE